MLSMNTDGVKITTRKRKNISPNVGGTTTLISLLVVGQKPVDAHFRSSTHVCVCHLSLDVLIQTMWNRRPVWLVRWQGECNLYQHGFAFV